MEINEKTIKEYKNYLIQEEKAKETVERYISEIRTFAVNNSAMNYRASGNLPKQVLPWVRP